MSDAFYTTSEVAASLIGGFSGNPPNQVADFACGDGSLLKAVSTRWPEAILTGVDIDATVEQDLTANLPTVRFLNEDFLARDHIERKLKFRNRRQAFDLIVLNPPFSCKGGRKVPANFDDIDIGCSLAMAFLIESLRWLATGGSILALVPSSCLTSEKDRKARNELRKNWNLSILQSPQSPKFRGCSVDVIPLQIRRASKIHAVVEEAQQQAINHGDFRVFRGRRPNNTASISSKVSVSFVHTTELDDGVVDCRRRTGTMFNDRIVTGPAILIPRVGRPKVGKVCWLGADTQVAISDCIIAITCDSVESLSTAFDFLRFEFGKLEAAYIGSCAKYITLPRLNAILDLVPKRNRLNSEPRPPIIKAATAG